MSSFRVRSTLGAATAAALVVSFAPSAQAFQAKHAPNGKPVHWPGSDVDFVLSPTLDRVADDARDAVTRAFAGWSGTAGAPSLHTRAADSAQAPSFDGTNVITFAAQGYAPAGGALAVTILTYDDDTGSILDCDIVVNGRYPFALLDDSARAASGVTAVSTEGGSSAPGHAPFDLVHVFAHEAGHSLGLSDEPSRATALMYPFTMPGDASSRVPSDDDMAGVTALYTNDGSSGCTITHASRSGEQAPLFLAAFVLGAVMLRRRSRTARGALVITGAFLTLAAIPSGASAGTSIVQTEVRGEVIASEVVVRDGVFSTDLTIGIRDCQLAHCPSVARATVWGGHASGVTQEISGVNVPVSGQAVSVHLDEIDPTRARVLFR